jgi:hypothetical protein
VTATTATEQPPALVLPDGWMRRGAYYYAETAPGVESVIVTPMGYLETPSAITVHPEDAAGVASALAARLVEAAGIVEQLRAGAR